MNNPAKENILLRREIGAMRALLERQPLEYTVRWLKLSFLTLRRLGWGEKRITEFFTAFHQLAVEVQDNDTWEDEADAILERDIHLLPVSAEALLIAGLAADVEYATCPTSALPLILDDLLG